MLASLTDEDNSNSLRDVGEEALWGAMRAQEQKLDRLEQTMVDLARLMGFAQKDHEEKQLA
jgi:hypothetical protein